MIPLLILCVAVPLIILSAVVESRYPKGRSSGKKDD